MAIFVYQKGDTVNMVSGSVPKEVPELTVGIKDEKAFVKVGGVNIPTSASGGTIEVANSFTVDGKVYEVSNPGLTISLDGDKYVLTGEIAPAPQSVLDLWNWAVENVYVVKVVFDGFDKNSEQEFEGTITPYPVDNEAGTEKPIDIKKFDGPNYIYYTLNGANHKYVIQYTVDGEPKDITIENNAKCITPVKEA